jgi:hypothetical protein
MTTIPFIPLALNKMPHDGENGILALLLLRPTENHWQGARSLREGTCSTTSSDCSVDVVEDTLIYLRPDRSSKVPRITPSIFMRQIDNSKRKYVETRIDEPMESITKKMCTDSVSPLLYSSYLSQDQRRTSLPGYGKRPWEDDEPSRMEQTQRKKRALKRLDRELPNTKILGSLSATSPYSTENWEARISAKLDGMLEKSNESYRRSLAILRLLESLE